MSSWQETAWVEKVNAELPEAQPIRQARVTSRINLYHLLWLRPLLESRWPQWLLRVLAFSGVIFTIAVGLLGSSVGSHNFAIIFVWIAWWTVLKLGFIPLGGRTWCSICPIPLPGEWLQRAGLLGMRRKGIGMNLRWPKKLRRSWLQSAGFLLIGVFSALTLTNPRLTSWLLLGILLLALVLSLAFRNRAFCTYLCPVGGFSGMYAQASPVEVRVIEREVCAQHADKTCYQVCPWGLYPLAFKDSSACGLCLECLRACPHDNLTLNLRGFGADLEKQRSGSHLDQAFLALVMLGSVIAFSAVFTGPWGWLKSAAFEIGSLPWAGYAAGYLALNLVLMPGIYALATWAGQRSIGSRRPIRQAIAHQTQALIPLGLMAWIAFTVSFAFPKLHLVLTVVNDPFGWGWNWLGAQEFTQNIGAGYFSSVIQVILLAIGLFWSAKVTRKLSPGDGYQARLNYPLLAFSLAFTLLMLWLLVG